MSKSTETASKDLTSIQLIPFDELETVHFEFGDNLPDFVLVTSYDYCRLTEDGVVATIFNQYYEVFENETDPSKLIAFIRWQLDKLDRTEARSLYEALHFSMKHEKVEHKFRDQWQELCVSLAEYTDRLDREYAEKRVIQYAYLGANDMVYCLFQNGEWRIWDASPMRQMYLMNKHLQEDPDFFRNRLTIINGAIAWDTSGDRDPYTCIDINPSSIYEEGQPITMDGMLKTVDAALNQGGCYEEAIGKNV